MGTGLLLLALGYLLVAPPVFMVGPLTGLLLISRPSTLREWGWVAVGAAWLALWLGTPGDIAEQALRAFGVLVTGAFLAITLARPGPLFRRALLATLLAFAALAAWCRAFGVGWPDLEAAVAKDLAAAFDAAARQLGSAAGRDAVDLLRRTKESVPTWAALSPALVFLYSLAGLAIAWGLYHRLSPRAMGERSAAFLAFRFSDQLIWLPVIGLALVLFRLPAPLGTAGANLLLVAVALYAARGLAVVRSGAGRLPAPTTAVLTLVALFLLPFVVGGLTLLGLADTWLDFRRRPATPATGG